MEIRLIAFDLDGTLLDDHKKISERSLRTLEAAAAKGVILVPATGRIRNAIPKIVMELPSVRYLITLNGAVVWDLEKEERIYQRIFSKEQSLTLWDYITQFDAMCDIYENGQGYMEPGNVGMLERYVHFPEMIQLVRDTRKVIPSIREYLNGLENGVEKFNMYFEDRKLQAKVKADLNKFPYLKATTSVINNIEVNHAEADKGRGLTALCQYLGIPKEQVMAFGDGDNDIAMLTAAGCGVAMKNAEPAVKEQADRIAESNNEDGLARIVEEYVL